MSGRQTVFSGMRPTGRLHIGNYWGALRNWVALQEGRRAFFCVVDWHMLTTGFADTSRLRDNTREMVLDWLAAGLDPARGAIFRQSDVPEHAELALLLGMVTPLRWLEDNPTWKEQLQELAKTKERLLGDELAASAAGAVSAVRAAEARAPAAHLQQAAEERARAEELRTFGFLGYPVLQAADILLYKGSLVPVGQDQLPHLEISRQIARRFNRLYGEVFPEPAPLLTPAPRVPGLDGRKMSKSYGNTVDIVETPASLKGKIQAAYTDPGRKKASDPGHPEPCPENPPGCSVFALHALYGPEGFSARRKAECEAGAVGCMPCKRDLLAAMEPEFAAFSRRREEYASDPGRVEAVLAEGARRARAVAAETMDEVRRAVRLR